MRLLLAQHGHAKSKDEDPLRTLSDQGASDVKQIAGHLQAGGVRVVRVWHSGKLRAEQTATLLARSVLPAGSVEQVDGIAPNDPVEEFAVDVDVWQEDTLVVGHLPFMSRLVSLLITGDAESDVIEFTPGSVACLERLGPDQWLLLWMLRPDLSAGDKQ